MTTAQVRYTLTFDHKVNLDDFDTGTSIEEAAQTDLDTLVESQETTPTSKNFAIISIEEDVAPGSEGETDDE